MDSSCGLLPGFSSKTGSVSPADLADRVTVRGISNARFWPDSQGAVFVLEAEEDAMERERATLVKDHCWEGRMPAAYHLGNSGGTMTTLVPSATVTKTVSSCFCYCYGAPFSDKKGPISG